LRIKWRQRCVFLPAQHLLPDEFERNLVEVCFVERFVGRGKPVRVAASVADVITRRVAPRQKSLSCIAYARRHSTSSVIRQWQARQAAGRQAGRQAVTGSDRQAGRQGGRQARQAGRQQAGRQAGRQ
jgi:hypothetical protein